jgi:ketosteroid isomerase-like protein
VTRAEIETLIARLHAARVDGQLGLLCDMFAHEGRFKIAGASAAKPIAITAEGLDNFKPWLSMVVRVFRLSHYELQSLVVEAPRASAHWRVNIYSKVTGITVATELIDLVEIDNGKISAYTEFFMPN